jgi:hypothetical protein
MLTYTFTFTRRNLTNTVGFVQADPEIAERRELEARRAARERLMKRDVTVAPIEPEDERRKRLKRQEKSKRKAAKIRGEEEEEVERIRKKRDLKYADEERTIKSNPGFWKNADVRSFVTSKSALPASVLPERVDDWDEIVPLSKKRRQAI